jgi:asparagine synthase (glutamine-hydrolysing)
MCGICGVVRVKPPGPVDEDILRRMRDAMVHRGPDDEGLFIAGSVGLGHRRLSIIDLSGGHQPMANGDETVWITYNGEVYNFQELRTFLEAKGYVFRTKSDTEVILHAYEAFGEACVEHLRGMFAFAIWDGRKKQLVLVRDRLGIKPLYYTMHEGTFLFASEIKAILQWPGIPREVDPVALRQYLRCRYVPGPRTMFKGILKLQPGHLLRMRSGDVTIRCYWDLPLDGEVISPEHADRLLRDRIEECISLHLVSDVPLGVFLSGGIDSTVITGLMSSMISDPAQTFAVGYGPDSVVDETPFARLAAEHFHTVHQELALGSENFWKFLPQLVWFLDEPVADPAAVPLYFLSRFARQFVTVVLSGEGGDEILAGYGIYPKMLWLERLRHLPGLSLIRLLFPGQKVGRYLDWARHPLEDRYRGVSTVFSEDAGTRLLAAELASDGNEDFGSSYFERTVRLDPLRRMLYFDLKVWLPDDLLIKADRMTMGTSVELRVPFLDHTLVEWVWRLPSHLKLRRSTGKYLLRSAMADVIPREILQRRKQGFAVPIKDWFRQGLGQAARQLLAPEGGRSSLFDVRRVESLITSHENGRADLSEALFTLAVLACWHRVFIESRQVS